MTKIIPRELIRHLEWVPGQEPPKPPVPPSPDPAQQLQFSLDDILNGKLFYDASMPKALTQALEYATSDGIIANMPEIIAAKAKADKTHAFWQNLITTHTEEDIGLDKKGRFYTKDEPVLVVVHGGGILTPDRIKQAYDSGLLNGSAKYEDAEFDNLLDGKLPDGSTIPLYRLEEILTGKSGLPHRFGVIMPYQTAQDTKSGYHQKELFLKNPLVIARAAGRLDSLEYFYEKAKHSDGDLGNYHPFAGRDASTPQGRVLFVYNYHGGLGGDGSLNGNGRFVGVAPEAHSVAREKIGE